MNTFRMLMLLCGVFLFTSFTPERIKEKGITTVVIDAGHGGHDSGCLGSHAKEKDVTLAVSLKLGRFISDNFKDVKVIYTRKTDVFLGLDERVAIANNNKADLFISIHCNSGARAAYGVETYVMGLHRTDENLAVSKRENSVVLLEKDYKTKYEGFDPDSPEGNIIFTLYQNAFLDQSLKISTLVQMEASDFAGRHNRGVKQAGFLVLYKTSMPSILIETGFLTNPAEERYLLSREGQEKLSFSLFKAFSKYKTSMGTAVPTPVEAKKPVKDSAEKKINSAPPVPYNAAEEEAKTSEPKPVAKPPVLQEEPKKYVVKLPEDKVATPAETTSVKSRHDTASNAKAPAETVQAPAESTAVKKDTVVKTKPAEKVPAPVTETPVKLTRDTATKTKPPAETVSVPVQTPAVKPQRDAVAEANPKEKVTVPSAEINTVKPPVTETPVKIKQPQPEITKEVHKPESVSGELYFTVQITTAGKLLSENNPIFKGEKNIISENVNGLFKYMTGKYPVLHAAVQRQNQLRASGFTDAFVVAYHKGTRITLKEAKMLLEKN